VPIPTRPKIRNLEPVVLPDDEQRVAIRDPRGLVEEMLVVSRIVLPALGLMDGTRTLAQIQDGFEQAVGTKLPLETLERIIEALDKTLFLDNERFAEHEAEAVRRFREAGRREAAFAGTQAAYPADPDELRRFLGKFFTAKHGPGQPDPGRRNGLVHGAVVPHIDLQRGGHSYAHVYRRLAESEPADVYVILGTNHHGGGETYTLTRNDFITPLGKVDVDRPLTDAFVAACGERLLADELSHRGEHSVEFQAVFLRYLHDQLHAGGGVPPFTIVPVICGGFHALMRASRRPTDDPHVRAFLDVLRQAVAAGERRVCVLASADLSHVGAKFGHEDPITTRLLRKLEHCDREMLAHLERLDAEGFYDYIVAEEDRRNVCGFTSIYTLLATTSAARAETLRYDQAVEKADDHPHSVVTFTSAVLS
jgi:hypothetical protein